MSRLIIRPATPSDAEEIARIHRSARSAAMPWLPDLHSPEEDLRYFVHNVLPGQAVSVAEFDSTAAGFIAVNDGWIHHLYVAPAYWRRGIGTRLIQHAISHASSLRLWTFQNNRAARKFYGKFGFEEVEFTDGSGNDERMPDVRMVLK